MNSHDVILQGIMMMRKKSFFVSLSESRNENKRLVMMIQSLKINRIYFLLPTDQIISCRGRDNMLSMFKKNVFKVKMIQGNRDLYLCYHLLNGYLFFFIVLKFKH